MKRIIALILTTIIWILTLTGCFNKVYSIGDETFLAQKDFFAKVESDTLLFDKDNVILNFYYSLYQLDNTTIDKVREDHYYIPSEGYGNPFHQEDTYAIYLSNNEMLAFETDQGYIIDHKNKVNAQLYKYITFEEAFKTNYGYTSTRKALQLVNSINYNHCEKLVIPAELFDEANSSVYIHIVRLQHYVYENRLVEREMITLKIKYKFLNNNMVKLFIN